MWKQIVFFFFVAWASSLYWYSKKQIGYWRGIQRRLFNRSMACRGSGHFARPTHVDENVFFFYFHHWSLLSLLLFLPYGPSRRWGGEVVLPLPLGLSAQCFFKMSALLIGWPKLRNTTKLGVQWIKNRLMFQRGETCFQSQHANFPILGSVVCHYVQLASCAVALCTLYCTFLNEQNSYCILKLTSKLSENWKRTMTSFFFTVNDSKWRSKWK